MKNDLLIKQQFYNNLILRINFSCFLCYNKYREIHGIDGSQKSEDR
ncbi:MAG: hypothetical protein MUP69_06555 [Candidatus Atribacteria bacterium]|nr:hypothetical protein [Candidatus Atribacteria bacterium]